MSFDLSKTSDIAGFIGACLVDCDTGLMLTSQGGGDLDLETLSSLHAQVMRAKLSAIETLALDDEVEDILVTLGRQYHIIRPLSENRSVFINLVLDKKVANLGMARLQLRAIDTQMGK